MSFADLDAKPTPCALGQFHFRPLENGGCYRYGQPGVAVRLQCNDVLCQVLSSGRNQTVKYLETLTCVVIIIVLIISNTLATEVTLEC